jgi:hypothetical protein
MPPAGPKKMVKNFVGVEKHFIFKNKNGESRIKE